MRPYTPRPDYKQILPKNLFFDEFLQKIANC